MPHEENAQKSGDQKKESKANTAAAESGAVAAPPLVPKLI